MHFKGYTWDLIKSLHLSGFQFSSSFFSVKWSVEFVFEVFVSNKIHPRKYTGFSKVRICGYGLFFQSELHGKTIQDLGRRNNKEMGHISPSLSLSVNKINMNMNMNMNINIDLFQNHLFCMKMNIGSFLTYRKNGMVKLYDLNFKDLVLEPTSILSMCVYVCANPRVWGCVRELN